MSDRKVTVAIGADTTEFDRQMKKADSGIRSTQKSADALAKSLEIKYDASRAIQAQKQYQTAIDQTEEKSKKLRAELDKLKTAGQVDTERYAKLELALAQNEAKALDLQQRLEKVKNVQIEQLNKKFDSLGESLTKAGQRLSGLSVAAAGVIAGAAAIGKSAAATGAEIDDMTQRFDVSAETVQRWNYLAMQAGVDATAFSRALIRARAAMAYLSTGTSNAASEALTALGISAKQFGSDEEMFDGILSALAQVEDSTLQTAYANEIFGDKIATQLLPYINAGEEDLAKWNAEFEAMPSLTGEEAAALAELDDTFNRLKTTMTYATAQLGEALAPVIERVVAFIEEKAVPAIEAVAEWFESLPDGMQDMLLALTGILAVAAPLLLLFGRFVPLLKMLTGLFANFNKAQLVMAAGYAAIAGAAALALNMIFNWKDMTWVENLLSALAIAALTAAAAVAVFHASWSLGALIGVIAAGVVAAIAMIKAASDEIMPGNDLDFSEEGITNRANATLNDAYLSPYGDASGGGSTYTDNTYADQYNVTVNVTSPGATAEEIAAAVGREIATLAQSRR